MKTKAETEDIGCIKWEFEFPFYKYQKEIKNANKTELSLIKLCFKKVQKARKKYNEAVLRLESWEKSAENYLKSLQK